MGGASRIPWRSIEHYSSSYLFDDEFVLARFMWAMDDVFLEWLADKQKKTDAD